MTEQTNDTSEYVSYQREASSNDNSSSYESSSDDLSSDDLFGYSDRATRDFDDSSDSDEVEEEDEAMQKENGN